MGTHARAGTGRRRAARGAAGLTVVALAPFAWASGDDVLRMSMVLVAVVFTGHVLRRRRRAIRAQAPTHDALARASAINVTLHRARILTVHTGQEPALVTVGWRAASTTILDADARTLSEAPGNGLTQGYTWNIPVDDHLAGLLASDTGLGEVSVYAVVDLVAHPEGGVREHGAQVEQYDLAFTTWSGSLPQHREPRFWDV
jgi:hypothetical protein